MIYTTDERLKSYLDTNQLARERMCLAILAADKRFTDVRPRHPRGGPDGSRDIEAVFKQDQRAFAAVGFIGQANDSSPAHIRTIKKKFREDLKHALTAEVRPDVFIFLTNMNLSLTDKSELESKGRALGLAHCEIMDRERLRIALDSVDGLCTRIQYLDILLSDAEQKSFFAKWGDDVQSVISTGFQRIEHTLDRLLFLQEASEPIYTLDFVFELDKSYSADVIRHFRVFNTVFLREPKHGIFSILFGASDKSQRMRNDMLADAPSQTAGIKYGISGGQWEIQYDEQAITENATTTTNDEPDSRYTFVGYSSSVGLDPVRMIQVQYRHDTSMIRIQPRLALRDLDEASYITLVNRLLADKIKRIHVFSNGYKLHEISQSGFRILTHDSEPDIPVQFTEEELADPWVSIRPVNETLFHFRFATETPKRTFDSAQTPNSLASTNTTRADE